MPSESSGEDFVNREPDAMPSPTNRPAVIWEEREPPPKTSEAGHRYDRPSHSHKDSRGTAQGWYMVGASKRGRLHAHEGTFREDAFKIECTHGWYLAAVADGAGSHRLSRIGSGVAVETAVATMVRSFAAEEPSVDLAKGTLQEALKAAWMALQKESHELRADFKDLGTTLLLLAFHPERNLVGVAQVGDGLLAAQLDDQRIFLLGSPDTGEYSGQTLFLTSYNLDDLPSRVDAPAPPGSIQLLLAMTDGVADDLYPHKEKLPALARELAHRVAQQDPEEALLDLIQYERSGSFDDRTLVVLCDSSKLAGRRDEDSAAAQEESGDERHAR